MPVLMAERIDRPLSLFGPDPADRADAVAPRRDVDLGGGLTLDDAIVGAWEGLAAQVAVACPLCGGALRPAGGEHAAIAGRCEDCGTSLT